MIAETLPRPEGINLETCADETLILRALAGLYAFIKNRRPLFMEIKLPEPFGFVRLNHPPRAPARP